MINITPVAYLLRTVLGLTYLSLGFVLTSFISPIRAQTTITHIELHTQSTATTILITCSGPVNYRYFALTSPARMVFDFPHTQLVTPLPKIAGIGALTRIRHGIHQANTLRLVFDLKKHPQQIKRQLIRLQGQKRRLILTLQDTPPHINLLKALKVLPLKKTSLTRPTITKPTSLKPQLSPQAPSALKKNFIRIVIDPGHGGNDPGAVNRTGVYEKTVTLAIAEKLQRELSRLAYFQVILTRTQDYFIPLRKRLQLARSYQADLFLSIHADAFIHNRAKGASVFILSLRGASSEAARWLAHQANYSELGGVHFQTQDILLRSILITLSQNVTISESLKAGRYILESLGQITRLHHETVEYAPFVVLKSPDVPSLLIETGFLSNEAEARRLKNPVYQQRIAEAIAKGVQHYFKNKATRSL